MEIEQNSVEPVITIYLKSTLAWWNIIRNTLRILLNINIPRHHRYCPPPFSSFSASFNRKKNQLAFHARQLRLQFLKLHPAKPTPNLEVPEREVPGEKPGHRPVCRAHSHLPRHQMVNEVLTVEVFLRTQTYSPLSNSAENERNNWPTSKRFKSRDEGRKRFKCEQKRSRLPFSITGAKTKRGSKIYGKYRYHARKK